MKNRSPTHHKENVDDDQDHSDDVGARVQLAAHGEQYSSYREGWMYHEISIRRSIVGIGSDLYSATAVITSHARTLKLASTFVEGCGWISAHAQFRVTNYKGQPKIRFHPRYSGKSSHRSVMLVY